MKQLAQSRRVDLFVFHAEEETHHQQLVLSDLFPSAEIQLLTGLIDGDGAEESREGELQFVLYSAVDEQCSAKIQPEGLL